VKEAIDILDNPQHQNQLDPNARWLLRQLYLVTGRAYEILEANPNIEDPWTTVLVSAAIGDYHKADRYLEQMVNERAETGMEQLLGFVRAQSFSPVPMTTLAETIFRTLEFASANVRAGADLQVIRGVLALEVGDTKEAGLHLRRALETTASPAYLARLATLLAPVSVPEVIVLYAGTGSSPSGPVVSFSTRPLALRYLHLLREAQQPAVKTDAGNRN
jgi:hypothetical protein